MTPEKFQVLYITSPLHGDLNVLTLVVNKEGDVVTLDRIDLSTRVFSNEGFWSDAVPLTGLLYLLEDFVAEVNRMDKNTIDPLTYIKHQINDVAQDFLHAKLYEMRLEEYEHKPLSPLSPKDVDKWLEEVTERLGRRPYAPYDPKPYDYAPPYVVPYNPPYTPRPLEFWWGTNTHTITAVSP